MAQGGTVYDAASQGMQNAGGVFGNVATGNPILESMNSYVNPYQQQVISDTTGRMNDQLDQNLIGVGDQAQQASAFGGSRHGLVESQTMDNTNRNIAEMTANMNRSGFMDQAGLGAQDVGFNLSGAGGLANASNTAFGMGQQLNQNQMQQGSLQQSLMQAILGQGAGQYQGFVDQPQKSIDALLAHLGGSPLTANVESVQKPGMMDYVSLIGQTVGKMMSGGII